MKKIPRCCPEQTNDKDKEKKRIVKLKPRIWFALSSRRDSEIKMKSFLCGSLLFISSCVNFAVEILKIMRNKDEASFPCEIKPNSS